MKKIAFVLIAILIVSSVAMSQMAKQGQWGIQTSLGGANSPVQSTSTIGAKFMASDNVAVRVEVGVSSVTPSGGSASTGYAIGAGFEYHMDAHGNVSPY